jgi:hypothetical protein
MSDPKASLHDLCGRIAALTPDDVHPCLRAHYMREGPVDATPFTGFIGPRYVAGGVVFVTRNGASGKSDVHVRADRRLMELTRELANASAIERRASFDKLMNHLGGIIPGWGPYRYVAAFLEQTQLSLDRVAYINMIPFRTKGDARLPRGIYDGAWRTCTRALIDVLEPGLVVPLGKTETGKHFDRLYRGTARVTPPIRRSRGDRSIPPMGRNDIAKAAALYRDLLAGRSQQR